MASSIRIPKLIRGELTPLSGLFPSCVLPFHTNLVCIPPFSVFSTILVYFISILDQRFAKTGKEHVSSRDRSLRNRTFSKTDPNPDQARFECCDGSQWRGEDRRPSC